MRLHRRQLLGSLSAGALSGVAGSAFAGSHTGAVDSAQTDDEPIANLRWRPERALPNGLLDALGAFLKRA